MKKNLFTQLIVLILITGCSTMHDDRLIGTWQSDKDRTLCEMEKRQELSGKRRDWFEKNLGKLKIKYTKYTVTFWYNGKASTEKLKVAAKDSDSVVILGTDVFGEKDKISLVTFEDENTYWIYSKMADYVEYFKRINE
jgi:hypothetical protein